MKKQVKKGIFCWMLRTLTKGWYLRCYKYQHRNHNIYPNIYSREYSFLFRGNSTIKFSHKKTEQTIRHILIKLTKNLVTIQKQPSIGVLRNRCSENMQQIYKRTPMQKCDAYGLGISFLKNYV